LIGGWPSPFAGQRGKKLAVSGRELRVHPLPLADQEVAHHLMTFGERQGFEVIEGSLLLQRAGIGSVDLNPIEFGQLIGGGVVVAATDQDVVAAHGLPPRAIREC
jgi:hypothetical protein